MFDSFLSFSLLSLQPSFSLCLSLSLSLWTTRYDFGRRTYTITSAEKEADYVLSTRDSLSTLSFPLILSLSLFLPLSLSLPLPLSHPRCVIIWSEWAAVAA